MNSYEINSIMKIVSRKIAFLLTVLLTLALTETNASQGFDPFSPNDDDTEMAREVLNLFEEEPAATTRHNPPRETQKRKRHTSRNLPPAKRPRLSEDRKDLRRYYDNIPEVFILKKKNIRTLPKLHVLVLSRVVGFWTLWDKEDDEFDAKLKEFRTELNGEIGDALKKVGRTILPNEIYGHVRRAGYISPDIFEALDALERHHRVQRAITDRKINRALDGDVEGLTNSKRRKFSRAVGQRISRGTIDLDDAREVRSKIKLKNTVDNENYRTKEGIKFYIEECHTQNKEFESLQDFYKSLNVWLKNENIISRKFNLTTLDDHIWEMKTGVSRKGGQETEITLSPNLTNYVNGLKHDAKALMNSKLENVFEYLCLRMENNKLPTDSKKALRSEYLGWGARYQGVEWKIANFSKKLKLIIDGAYDDLLDDFIAERNNGGDEEEQGNSVSADDIKNYINNCTNTRQQHRVNLGYQRNALRNLVGG